jgi:SAM-dependent methyltransferase
MEAALRRVGPGPGDLLDAGMGPGRLCRELDQRGWTVTGIDASPDMVDLARRRLPDARDRLFEARIEALPFADASFDVVVATGVLEYADVEAALAEIRRVLRPEGRAVVSYPNPRALYAIWKTRVIYPIAHVARRRAPSRGGGRITPEAFQERLAEVGLELQFADYTSFIVVPSPVDRVLPRLSAALGRSRERRARWASMLATQVVFSARTRRT